MQFSWLWWLWPIGVALAGVMSAVGPAPGPVDDDRLERDLLAALPASAQYTEIEWVALPPPAARASPRTIAAWGEGSRADNEPALIAVFDYDAESGVLTPLAELELEFTSRLAQDDALRFAGRPIDGAGLLIEVHGTAGAHGVTFAVLGWDGDELELLSEEYFSSIPGNAVAPGAAARLDDLDGDDIPEIVFDRSDGYVFYFASMIRAADAGVAWWDGERFVERDTDDDDSQGLLGEANELAGAGWWREARQLAATALARGIDDRAQQQLASEIAARAAANTDEAQRAPIDWLGRVIAGQWDRAAADLGNLAAAADWLDLGLLLEDTPLEGLESDAAAQVLSRADQALAVAHLLRDEQLVHVYLLRGLAQWWRGGADADLDAAASLGQALSGASAALQASIGVLLTEIAGSG